MQSTHDLDVKGLQRVTGWLDEVNASMHTVIYDVHAIDLVLRLEISIESLLNIFHDWAPRVVIVDKISKTGSVHDRQAKANAIFLNVCADRLDRNGFGDDV